MFFMVAQISTLSRDRYPVCVHFHKIRLWQIIMNVIISNVFSLFDSSGTAEKLGQQQPGVNSELRTE